MWLLERRAYCAPPTSADCGKTVTISPEDSPDGIAVATNSPSDTPLTIWACWSLRLPNRTVLESAWLSLMVMMLAEPPATTGPTTADLGTTSASGIAVVMDTIACMPGFSSRSGSVGVTCTDAVRVFGSTDGATALTVPANTWPGYADEPICAASPMEMDAN